ncbi:Small GTP-binding domain containing protein [Canna indica]|uniref:Small GTP-binding domain containing protein n=1 Tax=Canna indica TaxID=4628 RepID=A0AAQ3QLS1_9LILI|nr:Small GTP-binding domain containing protein [Canna indica]
MGSAEGERNGDYDYSLKVLLIGDSGVGKSSLMLSFLSNLDSLGPPPTVGVDFRIKYLTIGDKKLKITIWDTAGQEKFRTITGSYYRGTHGIIMVYDVTRRDTFKNLVDIWAKEVAIYSTNHDCIKVLVGNKVDKEIDRKVTREEGIALAKEMGCMFIECSAKTGENVSRCFQDLAIEILGVPRLLEEASNKSKVKVSANAGCQCG